MSEQDTVERAKFTPGPWKAIGTKVFGLENIVAINQDHPRHYIATVPRATDCSPPGNPDQEANARLIASAPDLLALLKRYDSLLSDAYRYMDSDLVNRNGPMMRGIQDIREEIRAAIAKAEGTTK